MINSTKAEQAVKDFCTVFIEQGIDSSYFETALKTFCQNYVLEIAKNALPDDEKYQKGYWKGYLKGLSKLDYNKDRKHYEEPQVSANELKFAINEYLASRQGIYT